MTIELDGFEVLSEEDCRNLLGRTPVGRVAITFGALPLVLPVNYGMIGNSVYFFTGDGGKLRHAVANAVVGFETDYYDETNGSGWSVMVVGMASEVKDPELIDAAHNIGIKPWASGRRCHLVKVDTEFLSGRRIATGPVAN